LGSIVHNLGYATFLFIFVTKFDDDKFSKKYSIVGS
jgi:hypothetical protein